MDTPDYSTENVAKEFKETLDKHGMTAATGKIKDYLKNREKVTLDIAITGESGTGKSTFINAYRGLGPEDEGSAPTGFVETTSEPTAYSLPYPNVQMWDLPGIGTPDFKAETYLNKVQFDRYDFFIIVSTDRFKQNDVNLALEIQKNGKKFYFVRSKIDNALDNERTKKSFNEETTKQKIRDNCIEGLVKQGITSPTVFLISSFHLKEYDFPALVTKLEKDLPSHKRHALLMSLPNISLEIHQKKKRSFQLDIWLVATLSGVGGLLPVPGLSIYVDVILVVDAVTKFFTAFGLDPKSLQRLADREDVDVEELREVQKSPLSKGINKDVIVKLLTLVGTTGTAIAVEDSLRLVPIVGCSLAGCLSFVTTYNMLKNCLNYLADDAQNVLMKVLEKDLI